MEVLVIGGVAIVILIIIGVFFMKPDEYDPTRAKIPEHMKTGVGWEQQRRREEAERRRRRSG